MHKIPPLGSRKLLILCISIFSLNLFLLTSCSRDNERLQAEAFLKTFMLEEGGVYTLFGDKPITNRLIFCGKPENTSLTGLSKEALESLSYVDDRTSENYTAWKRFSKRLLSKNFRFIERPCLRDPSYVDCLFVNVDALRKTLNHHLPTFKERLKTQVNITSAIDEIDNPHSQFWNQVFDDHYLTGLVLGFGEENVRYFEEKTQNGSTEKNAFSDQHRLSPTPENFPLPIFAISSQDQQVQKYAQQREAIRRLYKDRSFMDVTLERLAE